jgi:hypothetical protein
MSLRDFLWPVLTAMAFVGFGGWMEGYGCRHCAAGAHMFYSWGIIYAIFASAGIVASAVGALDRRSD